MSRWSHLTGATALACIFSATGSIADVTGQQVWDDWKSYMQDFGYTVEGSESRSGDTLTVSNLVMSMDIPDEDGTVALTLPELAFTDQGDGTVAITMPNQSTMAIDGASPEGEAVKMAIAIDSSDLATVVSGDPDEMTYSYTAASLDMSLEEFDVDGDAPDALQFTVTLKDLAGESAMKVGEVRDIAQNFTAARMSYELRIVEESETTDVLVKGEANGLSFDGTGVIPMGINLEDPTALFKAGFAVDGTFRQDNAISQIAVTEGGERFEIQSTAGAGNVEVAISQDGVGYVGGGDNLVVNVAGSEIPFPVSLELEKVGYEFAMPLAASDAEQNFAFGLTLGGLVVPDLLWNIFDPSAILPRDPATLSFALDGKTRIFQDLMDPSLQDTDDFPGELTALTLSDLVIEVAGAELTGSGDFTFDNSDTNSFDGMPRPLGAADFRLLGGNALLDKLIQMGFVSEQDALGARMMMGLFSVPGPAEDELNSRIEVNEAGHVLANGQRLR